MAVVVVARELLVTAIRSFFEEQGIDFSAKWAGKWKMLFQCVAAGVSMYRLTYFDPKLADWATLPPDGILTSFSATSVWSLGSCARYTDPNAPSAIFSTSVRCLQVPIASHRAVTDEAVDVDGGQPPVNLPVVGETGVSQQGATLILRSWLEGAVLVAV
jgi:hypothetical protein